MVFVTDAEGYLHTYVYTSLSVQGESVTKLGKAEVAQGGVISIVSKATLMPTEHKPILSIGGTITCQVNDGMLATFLAAPYADIQQVNIWIYTYIHIYILSVCMYLKLKLNVLCLSVNCMAPFYSEHEVQCTCLYQVCLCFAKFGFATLSACLAISSSA